MRRFHFFCLTMLAVSTLWAGVVVSGAETPAAEKAQFPGEVPLVEELSDERVEIATVEEITELPIAYARIAVEYPDTIVECRADSLGILIFKPITFPLTMTVSADDFEESTFGLMNAPEEPIKIDLIHQANINDK